MSRPLKRIIASTTATTLIHGLALATIPTSSSAQSYNPSAVYQNPDSIMPGVTRQAWATQPCRDPWINIAYVWAWGKRPSGAGNEGECWPNQYSQGRWGNYNQLVHSIARYRQCMQSKGLTVVPARISDYANQISFVIVDPSGRLVGNDSASLIAQGGGNLVGSNGTSMTYRQLLSLPNQMASCAN